LVSPHLFSVPFSSFISLSISLCLSLPLSLSHLFLSLFIQGRSWLDSSPSSFVLRACKMCAYLSKQCCQYGTETPRETQRPTYCRSTRYVCFVRLIITINNNKCVTFLVLIIHNTTNTHITHTNNMPHMKQTQQTNQRYNTIQSNQRPFFRPGSSHLTQLQCIRHNWQ